MNNFFKTFFAALLGFVVGNILLFVFGIMILAGIGAAFSDSTTEVGPNSVLKIDFSESIVDNPGGNPLNGFDFMSMKMNSSLSLLDVIGAIESAAVDDNIKGIYINPASGGSVGSASLEEIRNALLKFKESGKFVYSYANYYSQGGYYFASVADKVYVNPEGGVSWAGLASGITFYKGLLDKLDLEPEVIRHGQFKAAVEPFILDKMSPENELQMNTLLGTVWGHMVKGIADARGLDSAALQQYASNLTLTDARSAVECGMVDSLAYGDDLDRMFCELTGEDDEPNYVSLSEYVNRPTVPSKLSKNKVAVVYGEGEIVDGSGESGQIGGDALAAKLAEVRRDDDVKAVVLRVNSPGGSALASEVVWHEMELLRSEKPVVVSMGNVAASGGYYISCPADAILASPTTITGSIGVFGLMFNAQNTLKDKLGVTVDVAKTNPSADMGLALFGFAGVRGLTPAERAYMQNSVEQVYKTFVGHVAEGRNLTEEDVDRIGGGRVWSGVSALEIGLIDGFGGLKDALALAAERAGVADDFRVVTPSENLDSFGKIMKMLSARVRTSAYEGELGRVYKEYERLSNMLSRTGVQAIMPYTIEMQ